jgi:hypothetical protein
LSSGKEFSPLVEGLLPFPSWGEKQTAQASTVAIPRRSVFLEAGYGKIKDSRNWQYMNTTSFRLLI